LLIISRCERIPLRKDTVTKNSLALALFSHCLEPNMTPVLILLSLLLRSLLVEHSLLVKYSKLTRCTFVVAGCPSLAANRDGKDPEIFNAGPDLALWKDDKPGRKLMGCFS